MKKKKKSIKNARIVSKKRYSQLIKKKKDKEKND